MIRALLFLLPLAVGIYAFIDCLTTDEQKVRSLPKIAWVFIILLFFPVFLGPIGWFVAGRPQREYAPGGAGGFGFGGRSQGRQMAPDDDPEFLASLNKDNRRPSEPSAAEDQAEMLKRWEEDLKHREDDLRSPDRDNPDGRAQDKDAKDKD
ncbi:PLD nuclease N-terminal domain-containing protein [Embleya sp. NPDC008237]|uniref:PLD nuclease N-terminal domain-containing protein n=1 Tax=Embleya sp. NPDC008237 TaxID=3363978 RepID=UPI0036ECACFF